MWTCITTYGRRLRRPHRKAPWHKTLLVPVTAAHIQRGQRKSAWCYPVALALTEATGNPWMITARIAYEILSPSARTLYRLHDDAVQRREAYDRGGAMTPFLLILERAVPRTPDGLPHA